MNKGRYLLEKSKDLPDWWVLTDTSNEVVIRFKENHFNDTQKVTFLEDNVAERLKPEEIAHVLREMADWMAKNHYDIAMPTAKKPAYEWKEEDGERYVVRTRYPRFTLFFDDEAAPDEWATALRKCGEFLRKKGYADDGDGGDI